MDDSSFKNKRKNLIGISLIMILYKYLRVKPQDNIKVFEFEIPLTEPENVNIILWILFGYFAYRLYAEWMHSERQKYKEDQYIQVYRPFIEKICNTIIERHPDLNIDASALRDMVRSNFQDPANRLGDDIYIFIPVPSGNPEILEQYILRQGWMKANVWTGKDEWEHYVKLRMQNILSGKYLSEIGIPILLTISVLIYIGIPTILDWP